jgi:hypothetical protein
MSWQKGTEVMAVAHQGTHHTQEAREVAHAMRKPNMIIARAAAFACQELDGFAHEIKFAALITVRTPRSALR